MFNWLYVLCTIDLFLVAFDSTMVDLGNSILKTLNGSKFPSLPMPILFAYYQFLSYWMSKFSYSLSQGFCYSQFSQVHGLPLLYGFHACLSSWGAGLVHVWPLKLWHTTLKWFCLPHTLHVFLNAGHCLCMCAVPKYLQFSILCSLVCSSDCCL